MPSIVTNSRKRLASPAPVRVRPRASSSTTAHVVEQLPQPVFRGDNAVAQTIVDPTWLLSGPAETGKTWGALWRLDSECRKWPNSQWLLVRKIRATMDGTVLNTWRRVIAIRGDVETFGGEKPQWYTYPNGARVWVVGFDNPAKILSGEYDGAVINQAEDLELQDLETLTTRVTGRGAVTDTPMVWGDCNPGPADHWIKRLEQHGSLTLLVTTHKDNPSLYDEHGTLTPQGVKSMRRLDALTGARRLRLRDGLWVGVEGQYFTEWDAQRHVCAPFDVPRDWRIWGALDYGYSHNTAFVLLTEHDGHVFVIGEHVASRWLIPQHVDAMRGLLRRVCPWVQLELLDCVAGHDVFAQKGDELAQTIAQQYAKHGLTLRHAQIDRVTGAQGLAERLGNAAAGLAPTLHVFDRCSRVISTIPAMPTDPIRPEDVKKTDSDDEGRGGDDAYDALRYGLMEATRPSMGAYADSYAQSARTSSRRGRK